MLPPNSYQHMLDRARRQEMQNTAARSRQAAACRSSNNAVLAGLGKHMVRWGEGLQSRYGAAPKSYNLVTES